MVLRRKLIGGAESDVKLLPAPVEAAFRAIVRLEGKLLGAGIRLPYGGSLLAVATKYA